MRALIARIFRPWSGHGSPARWPVLAGLLIALVASSGCSLQHALPALSAPTRIAGQGRGIALEVVREPLGSVLVLVPVSINDQEPLSFVLDTGASRTVIDRAVAERLSLEAVPAITVARDVSGAVDATVVRVDRWRMGEVELPSTVVASIDLQGPNGSVGQTIVGRRLDGLLGSDILSRFGAVTLDYEAGQLILSPSR